MSKYVSSIDLSDRSVLEILASQLKAVSGAIGINKLPCDPLSLIGEFNPDNDKVIGKSNAIHLDNKHDVERIRSILGFRRVTNSLLYPQNGYMTWHTNSNAKGDRAYIVYNYGMSVFAYVDPDSQKTVYEIEPVGEWFARRFTIPEDKLLWHAIASSSGRIAFGFYV